MTDSRRHVILGTAGHVDHGKTELVRALTGVDTDRLREEKERGISIELGFAPLELDDVFVGIVDVPGHERFVRHMVAGAGGIDLAMLLVAADEGVMPQTVEHMEVLRSLRIPAGVVVISKCDLGSADTMPLVHEEIADLVAGTFLEGAPVIETSARTGQGLDALREAIARAARALPPRAEDGPFRLAVDRVFVRPGIGVVVTGSGYSGSVRPGDSLELLPAGTRVRVRELQSFGVRRERGTAGERLAIALQGVKADGVSRGDVLATPGVFRPGHTVDVRLALAPSADWQLKNRDRVRIHHGAREVFGRVVLLERDVLSPGEDALAQLRLESPLVVARGDAFVVRRYSPPRVVGGGTVIEPHAPRRKRFDAEALERVRVLESGDPREEARAALREAGERGVRAEEIDEAILRDLVEGGEAVRAGDRAYAAGAFEALAARVEALCSEHARAHRLQWGIDREELRRRCEFAHGPQAWSDVLDALARRAPVFVRGNRVRWGTAEQELDADARGRLEALEARIRERGVAFASRAELEAEWSGPDSLADAVGALRERDRVVELAGGGVIHVDALAEAREAIVRLLRERDAISVADVREALGLSRRHVIPLLERLDEERVTARRGNERARGPAFPSE